MRRTALLMLILSGAACAPPQGAAPAAPAEAAAAPETAPSRPTAPADAPPLVNGVYIAKDACPGEGCYLAGRIHAYEAADLYGAAGAGMPTGQIAKGEWVEVLGTEAHLVPRRGIVREAVGRYVVGDVLYLLTSQGEGCMDAWFKGASLTWCDPDTGLDPENSPPLDFPDLQADPEGLGLWVKVKREQGGEGWIKDVSGFGCTGYQDRDADCPALPQ